jgi:hypothetical protein
MKSIFIAQKYRRTWFILMILSLTTITSSAQKEGLKAINQENLRSYMTFFASDEMKGRETGTDANDAAALFIKSNLMRLNVRPATGMMDYYQEIPFQATSLRTVFTLNAAGEKFSTDSVILFAQPAIPEISGEVVFAGYAYQDEKSGYSDLKDVDMKDKIVLFMTGVPGPKDPAENAAVFNNKEQQKFLPLFQKGPKAIFIVYNPSSPFTDPYKSGLADMVGSSIVEFEGTMGKSAPTTPVHIGFITKGTADMMLKYSGSDLKQLQQKIDATQKPSSFTVEGVSLNVQTVMKKDHFKGRNVIGFIEGSDPVLKNECVVYTAHFDHTGTGKKGEVYNGADDDASGSMVLLEVANAFMNLKKRPLRSALFVWVNAEEKGLLGSKYYTENPVIPLKNTLLDINLDMVGRSKLPSDTGKVFGYDLTVTMPGELQVYTAHESSDVTRMLAASASDAGIKIIDKGKDLEFGGSDHESFWNKGVPAIFLHSGIHADLHRTGDDVDKIDFDKMEKTAKLVFLLGYRIQNQKERIKVDNPGALKE